MLSGLRRIIRPATTSAKMCVRNMGGSGHHDGPHINPLLTKIGSAYITVAFLWVFYRFKEDGAVFLGLRHPWEGHAHNHGPPQYEFGALDTTPRLVEHEEDEDSHGHGHH